MHLQLEQEEKYPTQIHMHTWTHRCIDIVYCTYANIKYVIHTNMSQYHLEFIFNFIFSLLIHKVLQPEATRTTVHAVHAGMT